MDVPRGSPASSTLNILPPLISTTVPEDSSPALVSNRRRDTEAIEGRASPRNPRVETLSRSSAFLIFEVACRSKASRASSRNMPLPLSVIWISFLPPASIWIRMRVEPASSEFSSSSFTTDAGRSTTSPAAILLATCSESRWIRPMGQRGVANSFADECGGRQSNGLRVVVYQGLWRPAEIDCQGGLHFHSSAVYAIGTEPPPLDSLDGGGAQRIGTTDWAESHHSPIASNHCVQHHYTLYISLSKIPGVEGLHFVGYKLLHYIGGHGGAQRIRTRQFACLAAGRARLEFIPSSVPLPPAHATERNED